MSAARDVADPGPAESDSDSRQDETEVRENGSSKSSIRRGEPVTPPRQSLVQIRKSSPPEDRKNANGMQSDRYSNGGGDDAGQDETTPLASPLAERPSSADGSVSTMEEAPSVESSLQSSPRRRSRIASPNASLKPFERRFQARPSLSPRASSRQSSVSLAHRPRQPSLLSQPAPSEADSESTNPPWEVVRWTRLRKITAEAFSETGKRNFGRPTCIAVSSVIALGTKKGVLLVFDYHQNLQAIIGLGTKAAESGAVTSIALSADHSTVAAGHARGDIFTWEIAKPGKPFLHIPATNLSHLQDSKQDGHIQDVSIVHIGFLGTRNTALVSADDRGMAFSHLASRGLGAVSRTVHTTRILGRYPEVAPPTNAKPRKPSSVLAFAPLPLGNVESATDAIGLVAILTPYLLVVVSTTPIAQTQHRTTRPKELAAHGALSAALAWYPSMKVPSSDVPSNAKLAYSWLNVLTILDVVEVEPSDTSEKERPPEFDFKFRKRWQASESIVAIQWLNRSLLAVITITQQLMILEDVTLEVTDSVDLLGKHMYHTDFYSEQLAPLIEKLDEDDASMHGVVADAFHMSFRAYKGRLFLLGSTDVSIGSRSNWADRLIALMEQGDFIASIQLATTFYKGSGNRATVGLPEDQGARQKLVKDKLIDMMSASLRYAFGKNAEAGTQRISDEQLDDLAKVCFQACLETDDMDFLFQEVFTWYNESGAGRIFLQLLETYILEDEITTVPPEILKETVNDFIERQESVRLEELVCRLNPQTMDLDQITFLCKKHKLYDALFYVWSQAIGDHTTILKELIDKADDDVDIGKIFAYLSYALTGRVYPTGDQMRDDESDRVKLELYFLLFSGVSPASSTPSSSFSYLKKLLNIDTSNFMSMLNEAFEDPFLNGISELEGSEDAVGDEQRFRLSLNRQYIVQILLQLLVEPTYAMEDIIYLDMFIARNLPKYQQFILLPGNVLHRVLVELCHYPSDELVDDCQLSVEYLLSVYQPPDLLSLIPTLMEARFFRVMKAIYTSEKQYSLLMETCFADSQNPGSVFTCARDCLRPNSGLTEQQRKDVRAVIVEHAAAFLAAGLADAADVIDRYAADLHDTMLPSIESDEHAQYIYLREVFEPSRERKPILKGRRILMEQYIRLLCDFDPHHVSTFVDQLKVGDLRLEEVLPALESSSAIDAAVVLMAREGKIQDALNRLIQHLNTLESGLLGLIEGAEQAPDIANGREATNDLVESIEKYVNIGIWLCQSQSKSPQPLSTAVKKRRGKRHSRLPSEYTQEDLSPTELLWLDLIDSVVQLMRNLSEAIEPVPPQSEATSTTSQPVKAHPYASILPRIRLTVQTAFSALLASTSSPLPAAQSSSGLNASADATHKPAFLPILSAFLSRAARTSPSLAHLRSVLANIFSAYAYEEGLLSLASRLLAKDLFARVSAVQERRRRGWRPLGMGCAGCGRRAWGPGAGRGVWEAWEERTREAESRDRAMHAGHLLRGSSSGPEDTAQGKGKGKGRATTSSRAEEEGEESVAVPSTPGPDTDADALVVFACRHLFHRRCLEKVRAAAANEAAQHGDDDTDKVPTPLALPGRWQCPLEALDLDRDEGEG